MHRLLCVVWLAASVAWAERPRLGVVLIIDQLSVDTFDARQAATTGGIRRMVDEGVRFRSARYDAFPTITSVGHATIATGASGETHGIVANEWIDGATGKRTLSTEDEAYQVLGRPPGRDTTAPTRLLAPTLGDAMKVADARTKVVTVSAKGRSAILTGGRSADVAVWFDTQLPQFVTSSYYAKAPPTWLGPLNARLMADATKGLFAWGLPGGGTTGANPIPPANETEGWGERMPLQPLIDTWVVDVALDAVKAHSLGGDEVPDLLVVSFSGHDRIGHRLGPDSAESAADYRVIDAQIGRLLQALDAQVGRGRYVVALTSDHGVMPRPEVAKAHRLEAGAVDPAVVLATAKKEAEAALGPGTWFVGAKAQGLVVPADARAKVFGIADRLRKAVRQVPGVRDLLPLPQVLSAAESDVYRRGAYEGRSPDFIVVTQPYVMWGSGDATEHGSAYGYDRLVPLVFFGGPVRHARAGEARVVDLAPTLAALLGVPSPPAARGQVLEAVAR